MATLLILIYIAFISLGLPDSLLGASWPVMSAQLNAPLGLAGLIQMVVSGGTILSSLMSNRIINRFKTGAVVLTSVLLTAVALIGIGVFRSLPALIVLSIPLGLGAGAIDAALNNFVARHYKATHMNWLHCFWGVGATLSPLIVSFFLKRPGGWPMGYSAVGGLQMLLFLALIPSLKLWKKAEGDESTQTETGSYVSNAQALRVRGVLLAMITFFCFTGFEGVAGLWMSSFLVSMHHFDPAYAAQMASLFYLGTTGGRFVSGLLALKLAPNTLIRIGLGCATSGALLLALTLVLPIPAWVLPFSILLLGLGNAPLFPAMIHLTPRRFGNGVSQAAMGLQMASAYVGATFLPPLVGAAATSMTLSIMPWFVLGLAVLGSILSERLRGITPHT